MAGDTAGPPPADPYAGAAGRRPGGEWSAGFVMLVAAAEIGWIGLLAWTLVEVVR